MGCHGTGVHDSTLHCPMCPTGLSGVQMGHKSSHGLSAGLRWTVPDWTLLESEMAVESKEGCPVESARLLCQTGLFWSPKRCPVESAGLVHFQETYNIHLFTYIFTTYIYITTTTSSSSSSSLSSSQLSWSSVFCFCFFRTCCVWRKSIECKNQLNFPGVILFRMDSKPPIHPFNCSQTY